ncbi:MAG: dihydroorotate dehydrogenase 2 [Firmicutes bacterium]|nr:dihydroorotate dehydrogenase 2 [Bacillota bacterium]
MNLYRGALRPALFRLPAESAHRLAGTALGWERPWKTLGNRLEVSDPRLEVKIGRLKLANPVGLGAGFDKDGEYLPGLSRLGFGYLVIGSILPGYRPGNRHPRIFRYPSQEALINCLGLPSKGVEDCAGRISRFVSNRKPGFSGLILNIQGMTVEEYLRCFEVLEPLTDVIELSLHCPNTRGEGVNFLDPANLDLLLREIGKRRGDKGIFVKIRSYASPEQRESRLELARVCLRHGVSGVTMPGSFLQAERRISLGEGNISGRPTMERNLTFIRELYEVTGARLAIKSLGGIFSGRDAFRAIAAGADCVELVTALVYQGWRVAYQINRELLALLERAGVTVAELRGSQLSPPAERRMSGG